MTTMRDLIPDYCAKESHPSLREAVSQPLRLLFNRTPEEDAIHALIPGDEATDHILYREHNPFLYEPYFELCQRIEDGEGTAEEQKLMRQARWLLEKHHACGIERIR